MPGVSPDIFLRKNTPKEKLPTEMISKEGDPYSWKYYYKLSKERKAQRLE